MIKHPDSGWSHPLDQQQRRKPYQTHDFEVALDVWGFALHDPATDTYTDSLLPDGHPEGSPQDALDCAVRLHLTGIADKPIDEDD